jgi:hypothetical protein
VLNRNVFQIDSLEAANIDCGHPVALWINAFSVRMNAARLAKAVLDNVLVERVRTNILFRCEQVQLFARYKPEERSFAGTHGTIACHSPIEFAFYLECDVAAVTVTFVFHVRPPCIFFDQPLFPCFLIFVERLRLIATPYSVLFH